MKRILVVFVAVLLLSGCARIPTTQTNTTVSPEMPVHRSYFLDKDFFDRAYADSQSSSISRWVYGGIIPHHLLASHLIADFFRKLEKDNRPETVVVIGPNHQEVGDGNIVSSSGRWKTPYGTLLPDEKVINLLADHGVVAIDERVFGEEHSISSEVAFIRKSFPRTTFVPIVLKTRTSDSEARKLAQALARYLPEKSLVIASTDFSHYVSSDIADKQDAQSMAVLKSLDATKVSEVAVDSRPTILTLIHYLRLQGAIHSSLLRNSNAAKVAGDLSIPEVTSYMTMYFTR